MAKKKRTRKYPPPYKSGLEHRLHTGPMKKAEYEPKDYVTDYVIIKDYRPDFVHEVEPYIFYEAKGRFRTFDEAKKYIWFRDSNPDITLRFILTDPNVKAYPQTKTTMGDWLTKYGFEWAIEEEIPEEWQG